MHIFLVPSDNIDWSPDLTLVAKYFTATLASHSGSKTTLSQPFDFALTRISHNISPLVTEEKTHEATEVSLSKRLGLPRIPPTVTTDRILPKI